MVQYKINDLTLASNINSTMQLETDIGGTTANKINVSQLSSYFGNNMPSSAANKYVDFINGSDITGNGTIFNPWQSLQHAYNSITPTINAPITIFIPPQYNSADTGPITGKPNAYIISQGGDAILPYGITISGGATNDVVYMSNLIIQDFTTSVSWVRNDATQFQMYLNNVQTFGPVILEQQGSGITSTFLSANNCFFSGYTVTAGQVSLFNTELAGSCIYNDSGSNVFFQMSGGNNASAMTFSGGILAEFSGIFSDVGYSITTVTTGSGTPNIQSDSASVPSSLTGPGTLTLISKSQHEAYTPADSSHWSAIPAQVAEALDTLAAATASNIGATTVIYVAKNGSDVSGNGSLAKPFLTIGAAATAIETAASSSAFNDIALRFYEVVVGAGVYTESVTFGTRPQIILNLENALVIGNITHQFNQGAIFGGSLSTPKFIIKSSTMRGFAGNTATNGLQGDLIVESIGSGSSLVHILEVQDTAINGNVTKQLGSGGGTFTMTMFVRDSIISGTTSNGVGSGSITFYCENCDTSSSNAIGAISGVVNLNILRNVRFNGAVVVASTHGRWFNVEFKSGQSHNFTGSSGTITADANSYGSYFANVPTKGSETFTLVDKARGLDTQYTPVNYTASAVDLRTHLSGIDTAIGTKQTTSANISFINVAETRSASINMADQVFQSPEIKDYSETSNTIVAASTTVLDITTGNVFKVTQNTDITTLTISNPSPTGKACSFTLIRVKDNSATARAITWPVSVKWNAGVAPTLSSTANAVDIFEFFTIDAGTTWYGFVAGQAMA